MSLRVLRQKLDAKEISAVELLKYYLDRIKSYDGEINSYITVPEEAALEQARTAQEEINAKKSRFLTGIPISVKDNICTKGIRTTCASGMLEDFVPFYNATAVERLICEGAVIIGKTNLDEFAMGSTNQTSYFGAVKNPHNTAFIPGGSSGGAAASVAADFCVAALATDTGGSVRQPAAFCGMTGLKPTYGRVSRYGLIAFASSLDQIGTITGSAEDSAYLLSAISGADKKDATSARVNNDNLLSYIGKSIKGLKIALPKEFFDNISEETKKCVMRAADFYKSNGAVLVETSLKSLKLAPDAYRIISSAEASSNLARFDGIKYGLRGSKKASFDEITAAARSEGFGDEVKKRILFGSFVLSAENYENYYLKALKIRQEIKEEYKRIFEDYDVILTPTSPSSAYRFCDINDDKRHLHTADKCTVSANLAGLPAISTVCGYDSFGMPIGMSIVGKEFDEARIIGVADAFEKSFKRREAAL